MTFKEYLPVYLEKLRTKDYKLIESDCHHMICESDDTIHGFYEEEKLTDKMKQIYPDTQFVAKKQFIEPLFNFTTTYYSLYFQVKEKQSVISVSVYEENERLCFKAMSIFVKDLTDLFIEEIKNLPAYRLKVITQ